MEVINKYFKNLDSRQIQQITDLLPLYQEWNAKINVISRKDIDHLYLHHVLHSMSIAKYIQFKPGTEIIDLGTGGGFPGIPLAILFPEIKVHLIDSIGKKLKVAEAISAEIGLKNTNIHWTRAEESGLKADFVVTRGVAPVDSLMNWSARLLKVKHLHGIPNGLIALKGEPYKEEVKVLFKKDYFEAIPLRKYFAEEYFDEKYLLYIQGR